ncbi:MAG: hypothetical protein HYV39_02965 [Candidatus Levybacteria bacterium]|nr:hypothetical protein [Candidatus Levybacteria bacterium]
MTGRKVQKEAEAVQPGFDVMLVQEKLPEPENELLKLMAREGVKGKKRATQTTVAQRVAMNAFKPRIVIHTGTPVLGGAQVDKD